MKETFWALQTEEKLTLKSTLNDQGNTVKQVKWCEAED